MPCRTSSCGTKSFLGLGNPFLPRLPSRAHWSSRFPRNTVARLGSRKAGGSSTTDLAVLPERHPELFHGAAKDVGVLEDRPSVLSHQLWLRMDHFHQRDETVLRIRAFDPFELQVDVGGVPLDPAEGDPSPAAALPTFNNDSKIV